MRISDWSSDVCSSDLAGRDTRELAGEQGLVIVGARRAQRGVDALALRGNDRGEPIFVGEAEPGGAVIFDGSTLVEVLIVDVEDRLAAEEAGRADMVGPTRSEEHTSELQSLMRISYAVFCLKTKKIQKNHQQHAKE